MDLAFFRLRRAILTPFLIFLSILIPTQAYAGCSSCWWSGYNTGYGTACSECAAVFRQLDALIKESTNAINSNVDGTRTTLSEKIDTATNAIVSALEKQNVATEKLQQADLNYDAATQAKDAASKAEDMFTAPSADIMDPNVAANACATMITATAATTAANNAAITARSLTQADTRKSLYTTNASGAMQKELKTYSENFCSDVSQKRGMCQGSSAAPAHMQDADSSAGSLLAPVASRTYSEDETKAARQYISNVIGPIKQESLPIALEKTPGGQRFVIEQRAMASVQSMASFSLNTIFSNNSAEDTSSAAAAENKVSIVGLMKKHVEDRFGDPKYRDSLATIDEVGLLRQITENMAFQNWMSYYGYLQGERTEGLLATTLALNARDRTERLLPALRQNAASLNK